MCVARRGADHLDRDRAFLTKGGVFTDDMIDAYIGLKMEEVPRFRMTTHRSSTRCTSACNRIVTRLAKQAEDAEGAGRKVRPFFACPSIFQYTESHAESDGRFVAPSRKSDVEPSSRVPRRDRRGPASAATLAEKAKESGCVNRPMWLAGDT